ncbi:MAG: divergent PAP2 family protein [Lachnospiraceae bacterium]|nr:divergent PAP2 family protein [Lachnospiraceae bacterium]
METLQNILHNPMFVAPCLSWFISQILKTLINFIVTKEFNPERLVGSGGMPSCHSATVIALLVATIYCKGVNGFEFPMAAIFAIIVMYDAMNVRMETGKQAVILNLFLKNEDIRTHLKDASMGEWPKIILKEYVGHTPSQVVVGIFIGILIGYLMCILLVE